MKRIFFPLILLFWLAMNLLLWRAEYGARTQPGPAVAAARVWERIRNAPDTSSLEIFHRGKKIGVCRWISTVSAARPVETGEGADAMPEGMVKTVTGYTIDFDGNLLLPDFSQNLRFYFRLNLGTNNTWRDLHLRAVLKPDSYEIRADAARQQVIFRLNDGEADSEFAYSFRELADPRRLLKDFEVPLPLELLLNAAAPPAQTAGQAKADLGLQWEARNDTLTIGQSAVRVYRLQAQILGRHHLVVFAGRAGEILRVELPGEVTMVNYALSAF
jgi:hypothetical protein